MKVAAIRKMLTQGEGRQRKGEGERMEEQA